MGFCSPMTVGFIVAFVLLNIILFASSMQQSMKSGLIFLVLFSGIVYFIEHLIMYLFLKVEDVPEEIHCYALRLWTPGEQIEHHRDQTADYNSRVRDYNQDPNRSCCAPCYRSARSRQFGAGMLKCFVCPILMFPMGKYVVQELLIKCKSKTITPESSSIISQSQFPNAQPPSDQPPNIQPPIDQVHNQTPRRPSRLAPINHG